MERSWQCGYSSHYCDFQSAGGCLSAFFSEDEAEAEATDSTDTEKYMAEDELELWKRTWCVLMRQWNLIS